MERVVDNVPRTRIAPSPIHGHGLFAEVDFAAGQLLGVLDGEEIRPSERPEILFEEEWNALAEDRLLVRPIRTKYGYMNHSPDPNCEVDESGRAIRALRDIRAGEEMTLDYTAQPLPPAYLADERARYLREGGTRARSAGSVLDEPEPSPMTASPRGGESATPIDFAVIQPLRYRLDTWLALRHRLAELVTDEGADAAARLGATLHLHHRSFAQFDGALGEVGSLREAFPDVLAEAREYPCLVVPLEEPARTLVGGDGPPADGLSWSAADARLLLRRDGEALLLVLVSGALDARAVASDTRCPQRELRDAYLRALERSLPAVGGRIDAIVGEILGEGSAEPAADALEESGGHVLTLAHDAEPALVGPLARAHLIQEGTAEDQSETLLGDRDGAPCFAHFGWAYSTIATAELAAAYRALFPVIAVNQAWYRYRRLRGDIIDLSREIHRLDTDDELIERTEFYNQVVLDFKIWEAETEAYERGLRPRYRSVYDLMWAYWDTDESREVVREGIAYVREFLDRKYSVKIAIRERSQARILFVLTILQLFGIFGLFSSYLYFWEKTPLDEARLFEAPWFQWTFVVATPILIVVVFAGLLVHFLRQHR